MAQLARRSPPRAARKPPAPRAEPLPRPDARDAQRTATRARVFEAALHVFRRDGIEAARVDDVAKRARVSHGTFYFHFPTKQDVLRELLRASEGRVAAAIAALPATIEAPALIEAVAVHVAAEWEHDRAVFAAIAGLALQGADDPATHPLRGVLAARFKQQPCAKHLTDLLDAGTLADLFLLNQFAAGLGWAHRPGTTLENVLRLAAHLFLNGARA